MTSGDPAGGVPEPERAALRELAERAARAAGELVRTSRAGRIRVEDTKSSPTDVVTAADRAAEELLRDLLRAERPDDAVLGEEGGADSRAGGGSGLTWVLDPIDGTVNYLYGIPVYAVSVAVTEGTVGVPGQWSTLAGCVHNPATGETWTAARGLGATVDGDPLPTTGTPPPLDTALVCTGFGYTSQRRRAQARVVADLLPRVRDVRRIGVSSLDLCSVAAGRADAYYERGLNPWDFAAAWLVATESGVGVRGARGGPPSGELLVAARAPLVDVLGAELDRLGADRDE
jgi:myo-inositol-1(or 4)-monophosphatase